MAVQNIIINDFLQLAKSQLVLDVRSPGEYHHAHISTAFNLPLFTDEERKVVGTSYKQQSRQQAIKIGLDYFGVKMKGMVEMVEQLIAKRKKDAAKVKVNTEDLPIDNCLLIHCWRGGMRSAAIAWLLDLYGFKVYTLTGGYTAYRKWVRDQFEKEYLLNVLGGYTGSGKTLLLQDLAKQDFPIIDLEAIAEHKGSAFGGLDNKPQPTQEMFENLLAEKLSCIPAASTIWIEDESQRIGNLQVPMPFWDSMRISPLYFMEVPFEERLNYLTAEYGKFEKEKLVNAVIRIQKRLGGLDTKLAINFLLEDNYRECFSILLKYYDKFYNKSLHNRENIEELLVRIAYDKQNPNNLAELSGKTETFAANSITTKTTETE